MTIIGILKREENIKEENKYYEDAVKKFGAVPCFLTEINLEKIEKCSGIIITGGNQKGALDDILIKYALENNLPLLGICQGMQSMALYNSLDHLEKISNHHQKEGYVHKVYLEKSHLRDIVKKSCIEVNSHHYEMVKKSYLFSIVGKSSDGVIEAIENRCHTFQIGVQWHPERMISYDEVSNKLFSYFIDVCQER